MDKKNVLLQPIFRDIKSAIRFMTNTEEHKLIKEYIDNRNTLILQYGGATDSQRCQEGLKLLEQEYAKLLKR
jgi:hypothetical protein